MSKRAERRHHKNRMKAKAKRIYCDWDSQGGKKVNPRAHHYADNLTLCSRYCCGNPRKWFKYLTIKELKFAQFAQEQEREYQQSLHGRDEREIIGASGKGKSSQQ